MIQKQWLNKYNSFNSMKALAHAEYWKTIKDGVIPPPRFVSVDLNGSCNYKCPHCNANAIIKKIKQPMSRQTMDKVVSILSDWDTKAVCLGGGGESMLNKDVSYFIQKLVDVGIDVGVVSNGTNLIKNKQRLLRCKWVGISIDSATPQTYALMKGMPRKTFLRVIQQISKITGLGTQVSYKYLLHPNNCGQVYQAVKLAKQIGCDLIHIRPGSNPWFAIGQKSFNFTQKMIDDVLRQVESARNAFQSDNFKIYSVTHKFTNMWDIKKSFGVCYAVYTTRFISPNGHVGLCCDRRGDDSLVLGNVNNIKQKWGSQHHIKMRQSIKVGSCPRCTYSHINEIFQNVIICDKMMCNMY